MQRQEQHMKPPMLHFGPNTLVTKKDIILQNKLHQSCLCTLGRRESCGDKNSSAVHIAWKYGQNMYVI